ncbi:DNA repair protein RAD51 homolog 4-like [Daphnia carinata]|uniref:DNA repair protein RAD51 homolog 4-like n=1 Tax=Daphnia carinata TaxID=120202 RepID=UPI00257F1CD6|nr:DNA repair protein RAD51 homolog 4-like [Daphnia carinata]
MNLLSESISPLLTLDKLELLKAHKVLTSLDFVQYNNDKIANLIGQNVSEIIKIKDQILAANNSKPLRGDKLYEMLLKRMTIITSGIDRVDKMLDGGIPSGRLVEVFGEPGSGKTQLALQLTANTALKQQHMVCYLTTSDANAERTLEIMHSLQEDGDHMKSLERIHFCYVNDVYHLMEMLWAPGMREYKLVVIDSLATLFLPIRGDSFNDAISLLNKVASDLKRLAVVHQCVVLTVNHVSRGPAKGTASTPTPFLGRYWCSVPNLRLHSKHLNKDEFQLTVVKNIYSPDPGPNCCFCYFFRSRVDMKNECKSISPHI